MSIDEIDRELIIRIVKFWNFNGHCEVLYSCSGFDQRSEIFKSNSSNQSETILADIEDLNATRIFRIWYSDKKEIRLGILNNICNNFAC